MSGVGWSIELPLLRLNEVICEAERAGGAGHTVLVIPHDPREPVAISLDGKPISHPESPERVVSVAMMMRNVEAGPALPRTPDAAHREHDAHAGPPCGQRWDLHTMAPYAPGEQPRVICPGARTARPPLTGAEVEGMLEYGKIRREVPATSLTAEEAARRDALLGMDTPWPTHRILRQLVLAAEHLLEAHDCDTHGHELIQTAAKVGRERLEALGLPLEEP